MITSKPNAFLWGFINLLLIFFALVMLVPVIWLLTSSLKSSEEFFSSAFIPRGNGFLGFAWDRLSFQHYHRLFHELDLGTHVVNSVYYACSQAVLSTICCAMGGYALAKFEFKGNVWITRLVLSSVIIPGSLLMAPGYKVIYELGLLNSYWGLILPSLAPAFGVFLFRQTMKGAIPDDLLESARLDGCGEIRLFFQMVLPLVRPMVATYLMITFIGCWNNFITPQIILQSPDKFPLSVEIAQMRGIYSNDYGLLMAGTVISIAPVALLFLMIQKEFIAGLTSGAVKG